MANRYWVGGTGTWSTTNTTNWSATSGGSGGASVPTSADSVFFDRTGTYTVTISGAANCLDFTVSAGTVSFAAATSSDTLGVYGSFSITSATTWVNSSTFRMTFRATTTGKTITTNGVNITADTWFNGVGGGWTLGGAYTTDSQLMIAAGTFNTGNFNITGGEFNTTGTGTKVINMGSSTYTSIYTYPMGQSGWTTTGLTFNAGTSTFSAPNGGTLYTQGLTFYNLTSNGGDISGGGTCNNVTINDGAALAISIVGAYTFANLTLSTNPSGINYYDFNSNCTITGTLTVPVGTTAGASRVCITSNVDGTARTLTCGAVSLTDVDFSDITIAGAAAPASGTRLGNAKGNSGITFPAAKTVYWNLAAGGSFNSAAWATTPTGTPSTTNFPLAQDTIIFSSSTSTLASGATVTCTSRYNIGTIDMSARTTNTMTLSINSSGNYIYVYGNIIGGSGVTVTTNTAAATRNIYFAGRTTQTITSNGCTFGASLVLNSAGTTLTLADDFYSTNASNTASTGAITVINGTFSATNIDLTSGSFTIVSGTKTVTINGNWYISSATPWFAVSTNTTIAGAGTIYLDSLSAKTFAGGGANYGSITLDNASSSALTITGSNTFGTLDNSVSPTSFLFTAGTTTTVTNFNVNGFDGTRVTIGSVTAATHTLSKASGTVNAKDVSISYSTATGGATWNALNSVNGGNNTGWNFTQTNFNNFLSFLTN